MDEKRKERRIELKSRIIVKCLNCGEDKQDEVFIDVVNVSKNGIGFNCSTPLQIGKVYEAFLTIWTKEVIHAFIEIVRIEKQGEDQYNYGGIFIGMPEADLQRIEVYDVVTDPERFQKK